MPRAKFYLGKCKNYVTVATRLGRHVVIAHPHGPNAPVDVVFASPTTPTEESHGFAFAGTVGPFRTRRAAVFMATTFPNPHCQTVADAGGTAR